MEGGRRGVAWRRDVRGLDWTGLESDWIVTVSAGGDGLKVLNAERRMKDEMDVIDHDG